MTYDGIWNTANAVVCAALVLLVAFPRARAGRLISARAAVARTLVASMAAAVCVSIVLNVYSTPFEVILNVAYTLAAYLQRGDVAADIAHDADNFR